MDKLKTNNMKNLIKILGVFTLLLLFTSCANTVNVDECTTDPYGFWGGLWHGIIIVFSWIGSLFSDDIAIYAVNNNGGWYDFGFIVGTGGFSKLLGILLGVNKND